jgi:hypothetical protein
MITFVRALMKIAGSASGQGRRRDDTWPSRAELSRATGASAGWRVPDAPTPWPRTASVLPQAGTAAAAPLRSPTSGEMPGFGGPSPAHSQEVRTISSLSCSLTLTEWRPCSTPSCSLSYTHDEARASPRHCLVDAAQAPHAPSRCSMECQARILEALYSSLLLLHITILFLLPILTYKFVITGFLFPFLYLYLAISLMLDCFTLHSSSRCT